MSSFTCCSYLAVLIVAHEAVASLYMQPRGINSSASDSSIAVITPLANGSPFNPSLFGLNDVIGPILQIPYDSKVLLDIVQSLRVGVLRHPGGTVANYWNITSGRYATTCEHTSVCNQFGPAVNTFPLGTFSPRNFVNDLAQYTGEGLPVFDLNVLTMNESTFTSQVGQIKPLCEERRCVIELGNELNLKSYKWKFPNAEVYMNTCRPLVELLRRELPQVVISAVGGGIDSFNSMDEMPWLEGDELTEMKQRKVEEESWRETLAKHRNLFDAVTIHDYTSDSELLDKYDNDTATTIIATWPEVIYEKAQQTCRHLYNDSIIILITEYNQALRGGKGKPFAEDHRNSGVHALNTLSHIMTGVSHARTIKAMQYHAMLSVEGVGWDIESGIVYLNATNATRALVNGASQLFAHASATGKQYSTMYGTSISSGPTIDKTFPVKILQGLSCLQAVFFANKTGGTFAVINRCKSTVAAQLNTGAYFSSSDYQPRIATMTVYNCSPELLGGWAPMPSSDAPFPWPAPVPSTHELTSADDDVTLPPFSFSLITLS